MTIDWSKAPEGATHYFVGAESGEWRDLSGKTWEFWHKGSWFNSGLSSSHLLTYPGGMIAVQRPPLEWNGEGLPPVGMVCEVADADGDWHECRVIAHYLSDAVFSPDPDYPYGVYDGLPAGRFRPLRTPEQIAAEERESEINEITKILDGLYASVYEAACFLYDAGYRKQEQTK